MTLTAPIKFLTGNFDRICFTKGKTTTFHYKTIIFDDDDGVVVVVDVCKFNSPVVCGLVFRRGWYEWHIPFQALIIHILVVCMCVCFWVGLKVDLLSSWEKTTRHYINMLSLWYYWVGFFYMILLWDKAGFIHALNNESTVSWYFLWFDYEIVELIIHYSAERAKKKLPSFI